MLLTALLSIFSLINTPEKPAILDTLSESVVVSSAKLSFPLEKIAAATSSYFLNEIESRGIESPKYFSSIVPNLHIPDYGSSMTSTIYVRGLGSRIDNPVLGLYVDDIPVLNKNAYDFDLMDIRRVDFLRGPQSTLFGRNSLSGVLSISTLSPGDIEGVRLKAEYETPQTFSAGVSYYGNSYALSVSYRHSGGYYRNEYTGRICDLSDGVNARMKFGRIFSGGIGLESTLSLSFLKQGGYPYRQFLRRDPSARRLSDGDLLPVNYNDVSSYDRLWLSFGTKLTIPDDNWEMISVSSVQFLSDNMNLDQDFTSKSMFTLLQSQKEAALTEEFIIRPKVRPDWWNSLTGAFISIKNNWIDAPVNFKIDGINSLILDNANANIPDELGDLQISEKSFVIGSDFNTFTFNTALYHESYFNLGRWLLTAGIRAELESATMHYDSFAPIHYRMYPGMDDYKLLETSYKGSISNFHFQLLPKFSAIYDFGMPSDATEVKFFGTVSKGFKAGGFNTQIFSDILQHRMMTGLMADLGVYLDDAGEGVTASNTTYKPEVAYNFETGVKFHHDFSGGHSVSLNLSVFDILCLNRQLTVFPPGKSTGRMMTNAGRSGSFGVEAELTYKLKDFSFNLNYGYVDARFKKYNDGNHDYSGKIIPYAPKHTLYACAGYDFRIKGKSLRSVVLFLDYSGVGPIWWNESNDLRSYYYGLIGANLSFRFHNMDIYVRGRNLAGTGYETFYFKSVGNEFFQKGKPERISIGFKIKI